MAPADTPHVADWLPDQLAHACCGGGPVSAAQKPRPQLGSVAPCAGSCTWATVRIQLAQLPGWASSGLTKLAHATSDQNCGVAPHNAACDAADRLDAAGWAQMAGYICTPTSRGERAVLLSRSSWRVCRRWPVASAAGTHAGVQGCCSLPEKQRCRCAHLACPLRVAGACISILSEALAGRSRWIKLCPVNSGTTGVAADEPAPCGSRGATQHAPKAS